MWKTLVIKRDGSEVQKWQLLQKSFEEIFIITSAPTDAAMFTTRESHMDKTVFYFSPGAVRRFPTLLQLHFAEECAAPAPEDVSLLVGHDAARDTTRLV